MNYEKIIKNLIKKYGLKHDYIDVQVEHVKRPGAEYYQFCLDGMPILPFFVDLAKKCKVSLENIRTDISWGRGDTYGYGGELYVDVRVILS